jgi:hypothetical protein
MRSSLLVLVLGLVSLSACTPQRGVVLHPQVQPGPAAGVRPNRVLVLHAACGSVEFPCPDSYIDTVDTIVRGGLEFDGYNLVEAEGLRNQTRQRHEEHSSTSSNSASTTNTKVERPLAFDDNVTTTSNASSGTQTSFVVLDGPGFEDLSVDERRAVLQKSGADAVLSVRIVVGGAVGVWVPNQNVEVMVKLGVNLGDAMAWASRCTASSNDFSTVNAALENAARCAIYGGTGKQ